MRVVHLNIRLSQGGAGRMGFDLHRRLVGAGTDSRLLYGYASGIADDPAGVDDDTVTRVGTKPAVLLNFAAHRLLGRDHVTGSPATIRDAIAAADLVHVHAPHHYYLDWYWLLRTIRALRRPVVITAHDWWFVTGRCGFVFDCTGWQRACGECGDRRHHHHLPSWPDRSRHHRAGRLAALRPLRDDIVFACPSGHLAGDYRRVLTDYDIRTVPNGTDLEFEAALAAAPPRDAERRGYLFSAADLSGRGKIDPGLVRAMAALPDMSVVLAGRSNPFGTNGAFHYLGEIADRATMATTLRSVRALMFCSRIDNAPLTIIEALASGCYVVAYQSPAAQEMLARVGGRCVAGVDEALAVVEAGGEAALFDGQSRDQIARRAMAEFGGQAMMARYRDLYAELLDRTGRRGSPAEVRA